MTDPKNSIRNLKDIIITYNYHSKGKYTSVVITEIGNARLIQCMAWSYFPNLRTAHRI
jgi:hypothetical protein